MCLDARPSSDLSGIATFRRELSVHGNVNAIGGLADKLSAAARHGRRVVVIPAENATELGRLAEIGNKLEIHPVRTLSEAMSLLLVDEDEAEVDY